MVVGEYFRVKFVVFLVNFYHVDLVLSIDDLRTDEEPNFLSILLRSETPSVKFQSVNNILHVEITTFVNKIEGLKITDKKLCKFESNQRKNIKLYKQQNFLVLSYLLKLFLNLTSIVQWLKSIL